MEYQGKLIAQGLKFGIIVGRFNEFITNRLLSGALDALKRHGADENDIDIFWVPGAFEIPTVAKKIVDRPYDALICLGAVLKGGTPHYEYIAAEVTKGIAQIAMEAKKPVIYGIITADTLEQAIERAGTKMGNKGFEAAVSAVEMANLMSELGK